jgi:carboxyl-terminal processing protease
MSCRTSVVTRWHRISWLLVLAVFAGLSPLAWCDPTTPGSRDRHIVLSVTDQVKKQHLSRHPLDKEISERCLKEFLKSLDVMKLYFYQSDVDQFMQRKDSLCDMINKGDYDGFLNFGYTVFRTFLQRVDERAKLVDELVALPHDFTVDEEMVRTPEAAQYPRNAAEAYDRWRKRIKHDLLVLKANKAEDGKVGLSEQVQDEVRKAAGSRAYKSKKSAEQGDGPDARDKLIRRYRSIAKQWHQVNGDELLEMYLNAFTTSFDPHTDYMSRDTQKDFDIIMSLKLEGIGASLMSEDGYTVVAQIIPGGAADKDGRLKVDDKIVSVGQNGEGDMTDVIEMKLRDVVKLIRGKRGTVVRLEVIPGTGGERKIYAITREKIELKDHEAKQQVFDVGRKPDGTPYHIGVIDLPSFYNDREAERRGDPDMRSTTRDVRNILNDFNRKGVDAVVLDLRKNGGGFLNEAISLTGLFTNDGPVVQVKDADGRVQHLDVADPGMAWTGPLVVLTSKFSASASEILAGAIQDYHRGLVVGDYATHGKGTVQSLLDLGLQLFRDPDAMGALKITMQQFYRPSGDSTQKRGVLADIELPSLTTHLDVGEADLPYPVEFDRVAPLSYRHFNYVNPAVCAQLKALSEQRVQKSEKFQKVARDITRFEAHKAKKYVTLNEAKYLKEEFNAEKDEEDAMEKQPDKDDAAIKRTFYLDEVLAITADYLNLQNIAKNGRELGARN